MIKVKDGAGPKSLIILAAVANVSEMWKRTTWLTSGNDSKHMKGSRHYTDQALDFRSKDFGNGELKREFLKDVLERLGPDYQGILESENKDNEHFHFEYDPKAH